MTIMNNDNDDDYYYELHIMLVFKNIFACLSN